MMPVAMGHPLGDCKSLLANDVGWMTRTDWGSDLITVVCRIGA